MSEMTSTAANTKEPTQQQNAVLVQTLTITGVQASDLSSSTKKKNLESKINDALGIDGASRVNIVSIKDLENDQRRRHLSAAAKGVDIVYEITLDDAKGDEAAIKAKASDVSKPGSAVHTAVLEAVAEEAGVDKSSLTLVASSVKKDTATVPETLSDANDTSSSTTNMSEMTIVIIVSVAGGGAGGALLVVALGLICRRAKLKKNKQNKTAVVPAGDTTPPNEMIMIQKKEAAATRAWDTGE